MSHGHFITIRVHTHTHIYICVYVYIFILMQVWYIKIDIYECIIYILLLFLLGILKEKKEQPKIICKRYMKRR